MPIIIVKGSDKISNAARKKKEKKSLLKSSSSEDLLSSQNVTFSKDMTDVLDLKVYKVINPNFNNNTKRTILLGSEFYEKKKENTDDDILNNNDSSDLKEKLPASLLQKIINFHSRKESFLMNFIWKVSQGRKILGQSFQE